MVLPLQLIYLPPSPKLLDVVSLPARRPISLDTQFVNARYRAHQMEFSSTELARL
jgi:hypothetical protein